MKPTFADSYKITALTIILSTLAAPANSQPITPANDGTNTTINQNGNQFNIQGGTRSGANLFHSFDKFNVNSGQTANFLTTPDTSNILGRVTGGNASYINGLIQVIGGNSNLFLMNPAGIMFGPNASLNIPASFSVTTATGIGFDSNNFWFKAIGTNDYANLVGNPSGYRFNVSNPGAIVNEGNLTLNPGENLTLLGGTVINTGELSTPGGNITIAAVEGGSTLKISQEGHLLSLEVNPVIVNGEDTDITALSLPGLLTGGEIIQATSVRVNENGDVVLTDSNTVVADEPGTVITSGGIDVSGSEDVGGQVNVLGDRLALIDTDINADGLNGGGKVLIGGESQESSTVFNSQETFVNSGSIISANAIENGDGGNVIIWSDGTTNFAGNISAKGGKFSGNGGFVEVTGKQDLTFDGSVDVTAALGEAGTILLQPESITIGESENSDNSEIVENDTEVETTESDDSEMTETEVEIDIFAQNENADVTISAENIGQLSGNVILEADNDITVNEKIETDSSVELKAGRSININADIDTSVGNGNIDLFGNNDEMNITNRSEGAASINQLDGTTLNAGSGTINIELGNLGEVGDINLANLTTTGEVFVNANGGNIARVSENSLINAGSVLFQTSANGGIGLTDAPLQLNVGNLEAVSGSGGVFFDVGNINIGGVSEEVVGISSNDGGNITLESQGDVTVTEDISADVVTDGKTGGDINIAAKNLSAIDGAKISASTFAKGNVGNINITVSSAVIFDGVFNNSRSGAFSFVRPKAVGNAGEITIKTGSLEVKNGALISSDTFGKGNAGNVEITATDTVLFDGVSSDGSRRAGVVSVVRREAVGNAGEITIKTGSLEVKNGAEISSDTSGKGNAGNVEITATDTVLFDGVFQNSPSGAFSSVRREAVGNAGEITIKTGSLEVKNGAEISSDTSGKGNAGNVEITATDTVLFDGVFQNSPSGAFSSVRQGAVGNAGEITIKTGSLEVKNGAEISSDTFGKGGAGDVEITATDTVLFDGVFQNSPSGAFSSVRQGAEGNDRDSSITITTRSLEVKNGALISSDTSGKGNAGNVEITATDTVLFDGVSSTGRPSGTFSSVRPTAVGDAGDVNITTGSLEVKNGAEISSDTFGKGNAGNVEITATDTVLFDGVFQNSPSAAFSSVRKGAEGNAGDITIKTGSLEVKNGARISSDTSGKGNAGDMNITATDNILFDGVSSTGRTSGAFSSVRPRAVGYAGDVSITTGTLEVTNGAEISSSTEGKGNAGNIFIATNSLLTINENASISAFTETNEKGGNVIITAPENLNITGNGQITVSSSGGGNAGQIDIISPNITLSDGIDINAFTEGPGNAGNINLEGDNINIEPNTQILAFTETEGEGGNITVKAKERVNLGADTQLSVETNNAGKAGEIEISTPQLTIGENAQISATVNLGATTTKPGGYITINTNELNIAGELGIFAETESTAKAGNLTLSPYKTNPNLDITFTNDGFISASTSSTGNGGNINISAPETINIQGNGFIAVETTDIGKAGTINIDTQNLTLSDKVAITASTEDKGDAGTININTTDLTLETGTSLTTETNDAGKAGEIEINTRQLTIGEDAQISATARVGATNTEAGGNITINANELFISGRLGIFAETTGETPAGTLTLNPYRNNPNLNITFTEQGFISARTTSIGDGGNINILAPENINISGEGFISVETTGAGNAGIINIETENLTIAENTTISASTSDSGDGGSININPTETFQLEGQILTETTGTGSGGAIAINTGELTAPNSSISAKSSDAGNAGTIDITAQENITTGIISSQANNQNKTADGGNITITSERGEINATQPIQSFSETANAGDVTLTAQNNITTNTISSHGQKQGGEITITSETGNIDTSNSNFLANYSGGGDAGNVSLSAPQGDITTTDIFSFADGNGGEISLKAGGDINIKEKSNIISASEPPEQEGERGSAGVGRGGDIILEAGNNINTTNAEIYSGADVGDTGKIDIIGEGGIETGEINLASGFLRNRVTVNENFTLIPIPGEEATQGVAGNITLRSNNSTIDTTAGTINSRSPDGTGNITLNARENIAIGKLEASALNQNQPTTGGDVSITSIQGQINATQAIETFSERGTAGNVNIKAEGSVNIENIVSQGTQRGGDITIDSRSPNSINAQGALNTFSTEGIAGDVNLTSPGNITINGIRSEGMQQGGEITVESEIGEINSTGGDIDSFSEQGIGGNVTLTAPKSVNLANVSSFGATESGDLRIQSSTATVNTGNVTTQAPAGSSGSIVINAEEVGTGDLSSIGTTSAGEINVEATDGSITTYDIEISSDGTIGDLILRATEDVTTGDINQNAGEGDANINIESGENQTTGNINQTAENDANNIQIAEGDLTTGDINQTAGNDTNNIQTAEGNQNIGNVTQNAGNDTNNIQTAGGNQNIGNVTQTAGNDTNNIQTAGGNQNIGNITQTAGNNTNNIQTAGGNQNLGKINQNFGNESINIQLPEINQDIDNISVIPNNNTPIINPLLNQVNPNNNNNTNNTNLLNQTPNNNPITNPSATNNLLNSITSNLISLATPSNNNQTINTPAAQYQRPEDINHSTQTQKIFKIIDSIQTNPLTVATGSNQVITILEQNRTTEYSNYLGIDLNEQFLSTKNVRDILTDMAAQTGKESAVVYINAHSDQLQIILYTKDGQPIIKTIPEANRKKVMKSVFNLRGQITNPARRYTDSYLPSAQQLYDWLIAPISAELEAANIDTLLFSMNEGLRTLPVAVLHDGAQFLIEKYSLSLIPSVSLMDTNYRPLQDTKVLTMGASEFLEKEPLPAVPVEIETISEKLWQGNMFLNEKFTRNNLLTQRKNYPYPIIHLATHADFLPGTASNSFIQLWGNEQLKLDQIRELGWSQPQVDLLVLSACRTAIGDRNAELGFAGLSVAAGVKSALASVWYVSDEGTLGLMTEFYTHLNNVKIKAEALRQAQLAMLRGEVVIADGELRGTAARGAVVLPSVLGKFGHKDLSHPYYWAGFTMVGSPW